MNGVILKPHITPYKLQNAETMVTATRDTLTARERARWENDQNAFNEDWMIIILLTLCNNLNVLNTPDHVNHAIVFLYFNPDL